MVVYLAPKGFEAELKTEIGPCEELAEGLFLAKGVVAPSPVWAQNIWQDIEILPYSSIGDATKLLKARGKLWAPFFNANKRRTQLISDGLPEIKNKPIKFMAPLPDRRLGAFTLLSDKEILIAKTTNSPFPLGVMDFEENRTDPPSRAYTKLWELFTRYEFSPHKNDLCLDLGSCPGGWTWVLGNLGAEVIGVDKAPLDERLLKNKKISWLKKDAFTLEPEHLKLPQGKKIDWLFSDIICDPNRLFDLVQKWRAHDLVKNFACTLKFKGSTDFGAIQKFRAIPGSEMAHLYVNKHEVTWWLTQKKS